MKTDGFDFEALAERYQTPFYLYNMDEALEHLNALREHLPDNVDVWWCMKANPNPVINKIFKENTPGLDISSIGEMDIAVKLGFSPSVMSFAGPGKSDDELRRAVKARIHILSVESHNELERLIKICEELDTTQAITVRINPLEIPKAFMMKMGGRPSQFGVPEEDVDPTIKRAAEAERIELKGIHIFSGTQCLDEESIVANIKQTLAISSRLSREHDLRPEVVNLGGGFGVPYFPGHEPMDVSKLSRDVGAAISDAVKAEERLGKTRFALELGRYLIGMFGVYVARVTDIKETRGKRFVIMNGGMHHCFAATGNFGQLVKKNYPISNLSHADAEALKYELVGPLCTPLDSMARNIEIPHADIGDLICFQNCGAYAYSASPLMFLGHDTPHELVQHKGELIVARERRPGTFWL